MNINQIQQSLLLALLILSNAVFTVAAEKPQTKPLSGKLIYQKMCAECHGAQGGGVDEVNENPLHGERTLLDLIKVIHETMPEEEPSHCEEQDAKLVAEYIYDAFYTPTSRAALPGSRIELSRLTTMQYLNTTTDLLVQNSNVDEQQGLKAEYFKDRSLSSKGLIESKIDPQINFDFGEKKPYEKIEKDNEFAMRWQGSIIAEETGVYDIILTTANGARLWINDSDDNLIDAWVSSENKKTEYKVSIRLLGGRPYRIRLEAFKYKEKNCSIKLEWDPPHRPREVIPARNLNPKQVPPFFVSSVAFPADEMVSGYVRGNAVSQAWDAASTKAAIEVANYVVTKLDKVTRTKPGDSNRAEKAKEFCYQLTEKAFRRPLTDAQKDFFVDAHFNDKTKVVDSVKRSTILVLKSPRFLYPNVKQKQLDDYDVANRLALALWDSLPNDQALGYAKSQKLNTPKLVAQQAKRMLNDPRTKAKLRDFFHHWLLLDEKESLNKDQSLFPNYDEQTVAALRTSLDLFLDEVVWEGDADFRRLMDADYIYMNDHLSTIYDIELPEGTGFRKVAFEKDHRAGVITHPYLMSNFAYHNLSSPIHRGVFVTRHLLGRSLKPPPQATEFKHDSFTPGMTTRDKVAMITEPAACRGCHAIINPLGFSLEHFDAIGRYRDKEEGQMINAASDYSTVDGIIVQFKGAQDLANYIASSRQAHGAFVDQLFHHIAKQPINAYGESTRDSLIDSFQKNNFNIKQLLVDCATVVALHNYELEGEQDATKK
ncbi:MAG: hypothetical protein COA78_03495 [Blastopirellula sp.]|nr:MAG: hypothetical protein COA78_03495 [Blastopirellula sp.]